MKYSLGAFVSFLLCFLVSAAVQAQVEVQQRVERYLYTNYTTNKALLVENDKTIRILEEKLDAYIMGLDKEGQAAVREQNKEMKTYLLKVEQVKDVKQLRKMVDESNLQQRSNLEKFKTSGLASAKDALECHKIIIMKLAENELINMKQEKLMALLKDDAARVSFIQNMIKTTAVETTVDLKAFAQVVDLEVDSFPL